MRSDSEWSRGWRRDDSDETQREGWRGERVAQSGLTVPAVQVELPSALNQSVLEHWDSSTKRGRHLYQFTGVCRLLCAVPLLVLLIPAFPLLLHHLHPSVDPPSCHRDWFAPVPAHLPNPPSPPHQPHLHIYQHYVSQLCHSCS
ncbi:hypothetical protein JOB18_015327 [Solea senegalensis]|uniref:Uncharacterized protein n=1 Tax=Solea senegalensis TaxID=28829 RepID=A0AAV6T5F0_SOLSE|nr:hypothetical protein JOB18_015327 [Solea senegalensis]